MKRYVYLVTTGDVESHEVLSAHRSPHRAERRARTYMHASGINWGPCNLSDDEVMAWERLGVRFNGRMYGYYAIEKHILED